MAGDEFVLSLSCPEQLGIVHAVTGFLLDHGCDIVDNRQFDSARNRYWPVNTLTRCFVTNTKCA